MAVNLPLASGPFRLRAEMLGALPIVEHFVARLGVDARLSSSVPATGGRVKLASAKALGVLVRNLVLSHQPVYALGEWAAPFDPALLGLAVNDAALLNDDRVGRVLALLFDADRASLLNRLVLDAVAAFSIDCSQLHNDSTSVTLTGAYRDADGHRRGANRTVALGVTPRTFAPTCSSSYSSSPPSHCGTHVPTHRRA